ncbi:unnamed protein product [Arabis nemorensis]|uniref:MATH domain-containing protein n=1 Tax=Arabis nemorensis TaxID=586526 RepID=A0A565BP71_9BRAS|nr:unnamed protein product [Arabis nemorensis]
MGNQMQKSISDNFSEKKDPLMSPTFVTAFCKWHVQVHDFDDHLLLSLCVENPRWITGWKRRAKITSLFCGQFPAWGDRTLPVSKLKEEGFLENDKLIVKVEIKAIEVGNATGMEMFEIKGFEVFSDQVVSVSRLFLKHPDVAVDFKPKAKELKTAYMNLLISLIETLRKPPQRLSETELCKAESKLSDLTEAGFKLDWLKKKLDEVPLKRKIAISDGSRVEQVEERIQNLKLALSDLNVELESEMAKSAAAAKLLSLDDII